MKYDVQFTNQFKKDLKQAKKQKKNTLSCYNVYSNIISGDDAIFLREKGDYVIIF